MSRQFRRAEDWESPSPAVHLLRLLVAPILQQLHVVEEQADHVVGIVQVPLHLGRVLGRLARVQKTDILEGGERGRGGEERGKRCQYSLGRQDLSRFESCSFEQ